MTMIMLARSKQILLASVAWATFGGASAAWAADGDAQPATEASASTQAQETAPAAADEIVVVGARNFLSVDTSGTTGLPLPIEKVPQSISLVSQDFLQTAGLQNVGQVADYVAGAVHVGSNESQAQKVKLRGFPAGKAIDGLTVDENYDPDYATVERLEVVKGPSSVIYGTSFTGGLINRVTKSAGPQTPSYLRVQGGSYENYRVEGQVAGALDGSDHVYGVLVGVVEGGKAFQHVIKHRDYVIYAGVNADYGDVTGYIHGGYEHHYRTSIDGIPTYANGALPDLPRSYFLGTPNGAFRTNVGYVNGDITWHATDMLELSVKGQYQKDVLKGTAPYASGLTANGTIAISNQVLYPLQKVSYGIGVIGLYKLDNLGLEDSFITVSALDLGVKYFDSQTRANGTANIFAGEQAVSRAFDALVPGPVNTVHRPQETKLLSGQAVLKPVAPVSVLIGASYSDVKFSNANNRVKVDYSPDPIVSYRFGLTWDVYKNINLYGSYSESFLPQRFIDVNGDVLPPLTGVQYEVGVKYKTDNDKLLITAAAYDITQQNQAAFVSRIAGQDRYRTLGAVQNKGVELEVLGRITEAWQVKAGFSHIIAKVKKDLNLAIVGKRSLFIPENTFSLYTTYDLPGALSGLTAGGGFRFIDEEPTSFTNTTLPIPSYQVVDLSLEYVFDKWSIQANLRNVFDKKYSMNNYDTLFYGNNIGTPRNFLVTLTRAF